MCSPPNGSYLASSELDARTSSVGWGGDGSMLYVTATSALYRIERTNGLGI
jgi:hypothetical protein